jgi:small GTP-binding protein
MAVIDIKKKVIKGKIVYYGPGLCGKTTNLEYVNQTVPNTQEMMSLSTEGDRTIFFDFLPMDLGKIRGISTNFKLYTVPGQVRYNLTRKMVLKNVDGVVFVADSQPLMKNMNIESLENLYNNLRELGIDPKELPIVLQYNKRDLPEVMSREEMDETLNSNNYPVFMASAVTGEGVLETLREMSKIVFKKFCVSFIDSPAKEKSAASVNKQKKAATTTEPAVQPAQSSPSDSIPEIEVVNPDSQPVVELPPNLVPLLEKNEQALQAVSSLLENSEKQTQNKGFKDQIAQLVEKIDSVLGLKEEIKELRQMIEKLSTQSSNLASENIRFEAGLGKILALLEEGAQKPNHTLQAVSQLSEELAGITGKTEEQLNKMKQAFESSISKLRQEMLDSFEKVKAAMSIPPAPAPAAEARQVVEVESRAEPEAKEEAAEEEAAEEEAAEEEAAEEEAPKKKQPKKKQPKKKQPKKKQPKKKQPKKKQPKKKTWSKRMPRELLGSWWPT